MTGRLHLHLSAAALRAELRLRSGTAWAAEAPVSDPESIIPALAELVAERPGLRRVSAVSVEVDVPRMQVRTLEGLPPVSGRALAALVRHQPGRYFRKNGKPLVTDAAWDEPGLWPRRRRQVARAAAIEAPWVDAIIAAAAETGLPMPSIGPSGPVRPRLELLTPDARAAARRRRGRSMRSLAAAVGALWIGVAGLSAWQQLSVRDHWNAESARLRPASDAVVTARRTLHDGQAMLTAMDRASAARAVVLSHVVALTTVLPDSAYLSSLEVDEQGGGVLTGFAPRAASVVEALERGQHAINPRLDGSPVAEVTGGRRVERFTIRFGRGTGP